MNFIAQHLEKYGQNPRTFPKETLIFVVRFLGVGVLTLLLVSWILSLLIKFSPYGPIAPGAKPTTPQLAFICVPYIILLFLAVMITISIGGSWFWLARRYRAPHSYKSEKLLRWQTGMIGVSGASRILKVGTSDDGLYLALFWPFAFMQPPLLIPWAQIVAARHRQMFLKQEAIFLTVGEPKQATIQINDKKSIEAVLPYVVPVLKTSQNPS